MGEMTAAAVLPGGWIGVLGSGQLGRMLALEARQLGYRVAVYSPDSDSPTGQVADRSFVGSYTDLEQVREFAAAVDVVTYEFENVPLATALACAERTAVHPTPDLLAVAQNRQRERAFLNSLDLPTAPSRPVNSLAELEQALTAVGLPAVLKTATFGYDGKGQVKLNTPSEAAAAWSKINQKPAIVEAFIPFEKEISVVGARDAFGTFTHFGILENQHVNHILDLTLSPGAVSEAVARQAIDNVRTIMQQLNVIGVLCVEFFVTAEQDVLVNELAPRPHNSGHLTIESHVSSQFEQQLRTVCGLAVGSTTQLRPAAMLNLLGDIWPPNGQPAWDRLLQQPGIHLHLYGKAEARPGRKMGHLTALDHSPEAAARRLHEAKTLLVSVGEFREENT